MAEVSTSDAWTKGPGPDQVFAQFLQQNEFRIQRCPTCGVGVGLEWVACSGRGVVHAVSIVNRSAEKGGPYNVVLVDLAEGPRMMSRVEGVAHEALRIGMALQARVISGADGPCVVSDAATGETT
jgi:hypothetical protein